MIAPIVTGRGFGSSVSVGYAMVCAVLVLSGITSTGIIPACIDSFYNQVEESQSFLAAGIAEAGVDVGAFLGTPYIALLELFGADAVTTMLISPVILVALGVVSVKFSR